MARHLQGALGHVPPVYKIFFWILVCVAVLLGWLGSKPPEGIYVLIGRLCTAYYFVTSS